MSEISFMGVDRWGDAWLLGFGIIFLGVFVYSIFKSPREWVIFGVIQEPSEKSLKEKAYDDNHDEV